MDEILHSFKDFSLTLWSWGGEGVYAGRTEAPLRWSTAAVLSTVHIWAAFPYPKIAGLHQKGT